jgi:signal transduction histidine kinase
MESSPRSWPLPTDDLRPALEIALAVAHGDMGVLMLHDDAVGALLPVLGIGMNDAQFEAIGPHHPGVGPFGRALATHRRVTVRDAWSDETAMPDLAHRLGYRGIDILPLFAGDGHAVGAIGVMFRRGRGTHRRGNRLVDRCAQLVVAAVIQAQKRSMADRARDAAEQIGRAKVQFLARMSHELRTPLQSIAGYLDLLRIDQANPLNPSQARHVDRMRASEQILVHVINDLITFSQLESGHVVYYLGPTYAHEVLAVAESVVSPLAIDRGVRLEVEPAPRHVVVNGDPDKLKQVLVNLTANAVKFTQRGGLVTLRCRLESDSVSFDVVDTGPGIAGAKLASIFEPYVQLGAAMLDHYGGSGLGLAISRDFARGMHGELTVRSVIGQGSTFTIRLPRLADEAVATASAAAADAAAAGATRPHSRTSRVETVEIAPQ